MREDMNANTATEDKGRIEADVAEGIRALLDWAVNVRLEDVPAPVRRKAVIVMADNISAMIAARNEPQVRLAHEQLLDEGARKEAIVFRGGQQRAGRIQAALANGIAGSWCELDEGYRLAPCHAGLYTLPAVLADAEAYDLDVAQLLRAIVLSYEVTARIARCWIFPTLTLHPHPQTAAIGGAAASGLVRGFDASTLFDAITAAASLTTVGHFRHAVEGAFVRNVWAAVGTTNGMRSADWALCGIGGSPSTPYSTYTELLGQPPQPEVLAAGLGETWAITQGYHKVHGCCQSTHSAVEAMLAARERFPRPDAYRKIERVELETHRPGMSNAAPPTTLAARFSFEHVVAAACVYGNAGVDAFSTRALSDPDVARLRERVDVRRFVPALPRPHDRPARITLHFDDGSTLTSECLSARGGPDQPFEEQVILSKVESIAAQVYPAFTRGVRELAELQAGRMNTRWRTVADELTATA
jgi:2-methylcitrate dehydratase PrpD